jgi:Ser/Thr protein kinase RdoA (MazF antagonist)
LNSTTPYANLDPHLILDAIESAGFRCSGGLFALNSFENRVYQIGMEEGPPVIAKFYRPGRWTDEAIIEEHQFALELMNLEIPVIAPLVAEKGTTLHHHGGYRFAVFPRQGGHAFELGNLDHLEWIGRFIGRIHAAGACHAFQHRITIDVQTYGYNPHEFLMANGFLPSTLKDPFARTVESLLKKITQRFQQVGSFASIRLHGDFHAGNILWNDAGPKIVDLDDCLMGPAIQDIWMLLSDNEEQSIIQLNRILDGYCEFYDYNPREIHLIEALRALRMIHYSGWLAKRWEDPAFPLNFPWFNTEAYWREQLEHLQDQEMLLDRDI